jgi:hypothetical protein
MSYTTYQRGADGLRKDWLFLVRTFVARRVLRLGFRCADAAIRLAPWVDEESAGPNGRAQGVAPWRVMAAGVYRLLVG